MTLEQHLKAGRLLNEIRDKLQELRDLLPTQPLKHRVTAVRKNLQTKLIDHLHFDHWDAEKNPDGSYAHNLRDDPYRDRPRVVSR